MDKAADKHYANFTCPNQQLQAFANVCTINGDAIIVEKCAWCGQKHQLKKGFYKVYDTAPEALTKAKTA